MLTRALVPLFAALLAWSCRSPAPPAAAPPVEYREGTRPAEVALLMRPAVAFAQHFAAIGEGLRDLSLLVARSRRSGPDAPLVVEIRNLELSRRYGAGVIEPYESQADVASWRAVRWSTPPVLERDEDYAIVLFSDDPAWELVVVDGATYAFGELHYGNQQQGLDLAFRATFDSGAQLESEVRATTEPIDEFVESPFPLESPYGLRAHPYGGGPNERNRRQHQGRYLPQCVGTRCADFAYALQGSALERAELGKETFSACTTGNANIFQMSRPVVGISCRDVCAGHRFEGCQGLASTKDVCVRPERWHSCDQIVSAHGKPSEIGCLCSEVPAEVRLTDEDAVRKMVRENYRMTSGSKPHANPGAAPYGITCGDVCRVLGSPCETAQCDHVVTPANTDCHPCTIQGDPFGATPRSWVVGDAVLLTAGGRYWLVDVATAKLTEVPDIAYLYRGPTIVGEFAIWEGKRDKNAILVLDSRTGVAREIPTKSPLAMTCRFIGSGRHAARVCSKKDQLEIWEFNQGDTRRVTPATRDVHHYVSWDGKTFVGRDRSGRTTYRWTVGDSDWKQSEEVVQVSRFVPSWATARLLDGLAAERPTDPGFVEGVWYDFDDAGLWAYDPQTKKFSRWRTRSRARRGVIAADLIVVENHVFDRKARELKRVDARILAWIGSTVLSDDCSALSGARKLAEPFETLCLADIDPETVNAREVIKPEPIEVAKP